MARQGTMEWRGTPAPLKTGWKGASSPGRRGAVALGLVALLVLASAAVAQDAPPGVPAPEDLAPPAPAVPAPLPPPPPAPEPVSLPPAAPIGRNRPAAAHEALNRAIELQRRGAYEQAAVRLHEADALKEFLTATESRELASLLRSNRSDLQARKQARALLSQADRALRDGDKTRGQELLHKLLPVERALASADKERLEKVRRGLGVMARLPASASALSPARAKVKESRSRLASGDLEGAERLAHQAANLRAVYNPREDTPAKVLEDVAQMRREPKKLLAAARAALKADDLDQADRLAVAADHISSTFTFPVWGDTPAKVRREIRATHARQEAARADKRQPATAERKPSGGVLQSMKNLLGKKEKKPAETVTAANDSRPSTYTVQKQLPAGADEPKKEERQPTATDTNATPARRPGAVIANTEAARKLLEQGRAALEQGRIDLARKCAEEAETRKPELNHWEYNPGRLRRDIQRVEARLAARDAAGKKAPVKKEPLLPTRVTPKGIRVAAAPKTQAEANAMLKEGRKLLREDKFDEVAALVQRIKAFDGHYGLFADSPDKLHADMRKRRTTHDREESVRLLKKARERYRAGDLDEAGALASRAQQLHGSYYVWEIGDRPAKLLNEIQTAKAKRPATPKKDTAVARKDDRNNSSERKPATQSARTDDRRPAVADRGVTQARLPRPENSQDARKLLAESQALQKKGMLIEARQKAVAAQKLRGNFGADELTPELLLLQLAALAQQRVDFMGQRALDVAYYGKADLRVNCQQAEQMLQQARTLATTFNQDVRPLDQKLASIAKMKGGVSGGVAVAAGGAPGKASVSDLGVPPDADPRGVKLLQDSLVELRKGQTIQARRLAEMAYEGPYRVKKLAAHRLQEIDIEELNQRRLEHRRSFDAAVAAFNRGDFLLAREILITLRPADLDDLRQARLRELSASPQLGMATQVAQVAQKSGPSTSAALPPSPTPLAPGRGTSGRASVTDEGIDDPLKQLAGMQAIKFNEMREESIRVMNEAGARLRARDIDGALDMLQDFLAHLPESQLDAQKLALLRKPIQSRIGKYDAMKSMAELDQQVKGTTQTPYQVGQARDRVERNKQKSVAEKMKEFNSYYSAAKYKEALACAQLAHELDPDNPVTTAAIMVSRNMMRKASYDKGKQERDDLTTRALEDDGRLGPDAVTIGDPIRFNEARSRIARQRRGSDSISIERRKSDKVRMIESKLNEPTTPLNFSDAPLREVIEYLRASSGLNIHPDYGVLQQEGISLDRPVTIKLDQISLKSALNLLLSQVQLTWTIENEVLLITTEAHAKGKLVQKHYLVADLVTAIENYTTPDVNDFTEQMRRQQQNQGLQQGPGTAAPAGPRSLPGGTPTGMPGGSTGGNSAFGSSNSSSGSGDWKLSERGGSSTLQQQLITLITNTIAPNSWSNKGGPGTIDYFPLGMTLVINQTPDIQEQIADLLAALRRLQDQEVAIELRLITIADAFYERLGLNLDVNIKTNKDTAKFEPALTTGQFRPAPFINDFSPSNFLAGITPAGTFTSDLDIPINQNSFAMAVPPFGGFPNTPGANGGLSLGLAFLSDIQVFLFMEAAQGDQRTNVMQAPKLTMFNGQSAQLSVQTQQFFVTSVQAIQNGGQLLFVPTNQSFSVGVILNLQPVISGDRRFVRINFARIQIVNLASAIVPLFPIVSTIQPFFEGVGNVGNPTLFTQFIQQPVFSSVNVQTTVVVPDGGTVLLGGLKRLSEGRNEFGPPILSKIPYISRLFKNVGYGREAESILLMVTPRIIINEEEEGVQTGVISSPALVQ